MWQREVFLLLYKINYNIFELHYSLQKEPKLNKRANKCTKTTCKNENKKLSWEMDYRCTSDSILQSFSRKRLDFDQQFGFFLFFVKWEMDYNYTFDSYYKVLQGNAWTLTSSLVSFSFALKFFDFFSWNWIFSLNSAITIVSNTSLLNAFLTPLSLQFP